MVRIASADDVDILLLQEVPVLALRSLAHWSGMQAFGVVAMRSRGGEIGRRVTSLSPGRIRSAFNGQANAILVNERLEALGPPATIVLNPRSVRTQAGDALELAPATREQWSRNRRVCQVLRARAGGTSIVIANMHLTHFDTRLAAAELERAEEFVARLIDPPAPALLGGDMNIPGCDTEPFDRLSAMGYTGAGRGIDHLLARGMTLVSGSCELDDSRRTHEGVVLSDHPIVEATFEV